jgi:hypothetical protein
MKKSTRDLYFDIVKAFCRRYMDSKRPGDYSVSSFSFLWGDDNKRRFARYCATLSFWNALRELGRNLGLKNTEEETVKCFVDLANWERLI